MVSLAADKLAFFFQAAEWNHQQCSNFNPNTKWLVLPVSVSCCLGMQMQMQMQTVALVFFVEEKTHYHRLYSKSCVGEESPLFFQKSLTGVLERSDTTQPQSPYEKRTFLISEYCLHKYHHVVFYFQPGHGSDSHQSFALPIYFWLLGVWDCCQVQACTAHTSSTGFTSNSVSSWTTTNGLGKLQKTTDFLVQYQTVLSMQKLHHPFNRNHKPERFITCLRFASAHGPVNSRTNNLHNWSPACTYEAYLLYIVLSVLKPIHTF